MANRHRGEIEAEIGGATRRLRLTLGALAELEAAFGAEDMGDLARRFSGGTLRARDAIRVIAAGLRGGGLPVTDEEVAGFPVPGGAAGYARIVVALLEATFGDADAGGEPAAGDRERGEGGAAAVPFPGGR
jgi:hypothetical protein